MDGCSRWRSWVDGQRGESDLGRKNVHVRKHDDRVRGTTLKLWGYDNDESTIIDIGQDRRKLGQAMLPVMRGYPKGSMRPDSMIEAFSRIYFSNNLFSSAGNIDKNWSSSSHNKLDAANKCFLIHSTSCHPAVSIKRIHSTSSRMRSTPGLASCDRRSTLMSLYSLGPCVMFAVPAGVSTQPTSATAYRGIVNPPRSRR